MGAKPKRRHLLAITITFDKPCTKTDAVRMVKDELKDQNFYPYQWDLTGPGEFWVRNIRSRHNRR